MDRALEQGAALSVAPPPDVELRSLVKRYGETLALDGVSLAVHAGEFFTLLGPSGCGKTTTLRAVAGFVEPSAGDVLIKGSQHYALFPHRTVFQNVAFGLRMAGVERAQLERRVGEALELVRLPAYGARYPRELSGGEQQRVALARALVTRPAVLLLDEPLGALDKQLRDHMQIELKSLQREVGITTIYVTHDQGEALTMSDRIAVMRDGRLEQIGPPRDIYESPRTVFVAGFIGTTNLLPVRVLTGTEVEWGRARVRTAAPAGGPGASVTLALRPERVRLEPDGRADNVVAAAVAHVVYQGETVRYVLRTEEGLELQAVEIGETRFAPGARVRAGWAADDARVLDG